jgi:hypothetical protein
MQQQSDSTLEAGPSLGGTTCGLAEEMANIKISWDWSASKSVSVSGMSSLADHWLT